MYEQETIVCTKYGGRGNISLRKAAALISSVRSGLALFGFSSGSSGFVLVVLFW